MENQTQIKCPNCGTDIDVQDILSHQLEEGLKKKFQAELATEKKKFDSQAEALNKAKEDFEAKKLKENELFQEKLQLKLKEEKEQMEKKLKTQYKEEQADQFAELQKELNEKSEQIKDLNKTKAEIEKLKREKLELKEAIEAETQVKLNKLI